MQRFLGVFIFIALQPFLALSQDDPNLNDIPDSVIITEIKPGSVLFERKEEIIDPEMEIIYRKIDTAHLKDRLKALEKEIPLEYHPNVNGFVDYFVHKNRGYTSIMLARKDLYFPLFEKHLKAFGLPEELKYLSIVESGLNPKAMSRVGAGGLWQFMPATGRQYKLKQDWYFDDRLDPETATIAACKYLKSLYNMFGDWPLALAAYNSGPGNVRKAIRRSGYKKNFWQVYKKLPRETRSYVPQFVAINYAMNYHQEHQIYATDTLKQINRLKQTVVDTVKFNSYMDLSVLSKMIDEDINLIADLNPNLKRSVIPESRKNYPLKLPYNAAYIVRQRLKLYVDSASVKQSNEIAFESRHAIGSTVGKKKIIYTVRSGDVLGKIADRYRVRLSSLRAWNGIYRNLIRPGQNLKIYVSPSRYAQLTKKHVGSSSKKTVIAKRPIHDGQTYRVKNGDTLWNISKKFDGATIESIKRLNNLKNNKIHPGLILKIG